MRIHIALFVIAAAMAGCSNDDTSTSSVRDAAPQIEADPTPDTGTGGDMQQATPDGTVNGAPGQTRPAQPSPAQ